MTNAPHPWPGFLPPQSWRGADMFYVAKKLGLSANLRLCMDAGDAASLPAASNKWLDLSGNGYDFFRGTTNGADATDPTINGTAGQRSSGEYLSFDGGDLLTYDAVNETWVQNLHKDSALFTLATWLYPGSIGTNMGLFGTSGNNANNVGIDFNLTSTGTINMVVRNGSGVNSLALPGAGAGLLNVTAWNFCAISINEAAGTSVCFVNGGASAPNSTYTSPSASNASFTAQIGTRGNNALPVVNGSRLAAFVAWEGRFLSVEEINALFAASRGRFGV
jgi:hypothetical protein